MTLNILLPLAAKSAFFPESDYVFPKPLIEVAGKPMIQRVIENLQQLSTKTRYIFVLDAEDCARFHLDNSLQLLTESASIIQLKGQTAGSACTSLLAIEHIDNDSPLLISNGDQVLDTDISEILEDFRVRELDAGVVTFNSVHPRWSFVRIGSEGLITEAAEKRPISKHAIAGFYYFRRGRDFVHAAMESIRKQADVNGVFYIAPVLNELILHNRRVGHHNIANEAYHTFYTPEKVKEYERHLNREEATIHA